MGSDWRAVDLGHLEVASGVNHDLVGFVQIRAAGGDAVLLGQVTPAEARDQAAVFLRAAEAAEHDAAVATQLQAAGLSFDAVAAFLHDLRRHRAQPVESG